MFSTPVICRKSSSLGKVRCEVALKKDATESRVVYFPGASTGHEICFYCDSASTSKSAISVQVIVCPYPACCSTHCNQRSCDCTSRHVKSACSGVAHERGLHKKQDFKNDWKKQMIKTQNYLSHSVNLQCIITHFILLLILRSVCSSEMFSFIKLQYLWGFWTAT